MLMVRRNLHSICSMSIWLHHLDTGLCSSPSAACQVPSSISISHIPQRILSVKINFWISHWYDAVTSRSSSPKKYLPILQQFTWLLPKPLIRLLFKRVDNLTRHNHFTHGFTGVPVIKSRLMHAQRFPAEPLRLFVCFCLKALTGAHIQETEPTPQSHSLRVQHLFWAHVLHPHVHNFTLHNTNTHIVPVNQRVVSHPATQPFKNPHKWQVRRNLEASSLEKTKLE